MRGFSWYQEQVCGPSGETILRSPFIPGGDSLTRKALNQGAVALGSLGVVLRRKGPIKSFDPHLVIGTVPALPTAVVAFVASLRLRVPFIIDLRDAWPALLDFSGRWNEATGQQSVRERFLSRGGVQLVAALTRRCLSLALRKATSVLVTSESLRLELNSVFGGAEKTHTVRNVFPPSTVIQKIPRLQGPTDSLNVLYAGTIGRAQQLGNAIEAARLAQLEGIDVHLRFVGAGAAKEHIKQLAISNGINAVFEDRRGASELVDLYQWADTALVHLADWKPLEHAVPSKTYELMSQKLHITGVVAGETAELIKTLEIGDAVCPAQPKDLARLWCELAKDRGRLAIGSTGIEWLEDQRNKVAPQTFIESINSARDGR